MRQLFTLLQNAAGLLALASVSQSVPEAFQTTDDLPSGLSPLVGKVELDAEKKSDDDEEEIGPVTNWSAGLILHRR